MSSKKKTTDKKHESKNIFVSVQLFLTFNRHPTLTRTPEFEPLTLEVWNSSATY